MKNVFYYDLFEKNKVRIFKDKNGVKWYCLLDIAKILGFSSIYNYKSRISKPGEIIKVKADTKGGPQLLNFVSSSFVIRLIERSNLKHDIIRKFKFWIEKEAMKSVSDYGYFCDDARFYDENGMEYEEGEKIVRVSDYLALEDEISKCRKEIAILEKRLKEAEYFIYGVKRLINKY